MAATATTIFTVPNAVLQVGTHGPFVSPAVGAAYVAYLISVQPGPNWPASGAAPMAVTIEYSPDGGSTWKFDASRSYSSGTWVARDRVTPLTQDDWLVTMGTLNPGQPNAVVLATNTTDKFRVTLVVAQKCTPTITMQGFTSL